ncbi:hypothetical protein GCM10009801_53940 [Streptomyces albiaxialis]|uniref:Uncharacterized protein n=1 Tax=Streptomyces albiaxialis TaxID=329523 RepID=A0ABN2WD05_9ACTN
MPARNIGSMRVSTVEDEPCAAAAMRGDLRLEAIAADRPTERFALRELVLRLPALDRGRAPRERLGEPWIIAAVSGGGYRTGAQPRAGAGGENHG